MKCIACGREMLVRGAHYECSNILCDYEEEIENKEMWIRSRRDMPRSMVNTAVREFFITVQR
ncbi:MAG: hypothetical protein ABSA46_10395 [Thermodesulfovibrionales bacterium]|jgi:hypothetical protein